MLKTNQIFRRRRPIGEKRTGNYDCVCSDENENKMAEATPKKPPDWKQLTETVHDADTLRQESINAQHDHLITEIETSDGPLGTTLRCICKFKCFFGKETRLEKAHGIFEWLN